jgi:hypothetical protein
MTVENKESNMTRVFLVGLAALLLAASPALAATIDVGVHQLLPNTAGQQIQIPVGPDPGAAPDQVLGVDFYVQVSDGGSAQGGVDNGPAIQAVDIIGAAGYPPTIFTGNNTGQGVFPDTWPQFEMATTTTASGSVAAQGNLATVVFDTTGWTSGTWPLILTGTDGFGGLDTVFPGVTTNVINGLIFIPEPSTLVMLAGLLSGIAWFWWRRRT